MDEDGGVGCCQKILGKTMHWLMGQLRIGLILLVTSMQACSSTVADQPSSIELGGEKSGVIEVHVRNFGDVNARIYALHRGSRTRLGTIRPVIDQSRVRVFVVDCHTNYLE